MGKKRRTINIGGRYRHADSYNTEYVVDKIVPDATGEEKTGKLGKIVLYTQKVAGIYPVGTIYARTVEDFLGQTMYQGKLVNTFELVKKKK